MVNANMESLRKRKNELIKHVYLFYFFLILKKQSITYFSKIAIIYLGFIALGDFYAPYLTTIKPEQYLATIA